ncbi:hypothetical protein Sa4125_31160 [Aureimonas sp. SA4125]|nr:hypothetical protein Sa4125_31160 [Aureimonas sp. SA4125]
MRHGAIDETEGNDCGKNRKDTAEAVADFGGGGQSETHGGSVRPPLLERRARLRTRKGPLWRLTSMVIAGCADWSRQALAKRLVTFKSAVVPV